MQRKKKHSASTIMMSNEGNIYRQNIILIVINGCFGSVIFSIFSLYGCIVSFWHSHGCALISIVKYHKLYAVIRSLLTHQFVFNFNSLYGEKKLKMITCIPYSYIAHTERTYFQIFVGNFLLLLRCLFILLLLLLCSSAFRSSLPFQF